MQTDDSARPAYSLGPQPAAYTREWQYSLTFPPLCSIRCKRCGNWFEAIDEGDGIHIDYRCDTCYAADRHDRHWGIADGEELPDEELAARSAAIDLAAEERAEETLLRAQGDDA